MHYSTILTGKITVACKAAVGGSVQVVGCCRHSLPSPAGRRAGAGGGTAAATGGGARSYRTARGRAGAPRGKRRACRVYLAAR